MAANHSDARRPAITDELRERLRRAVDHLDHVLPGQAPILNFVHHNTLHGYQHLPFRDALAQAERLTGISAFLPEAEFRRFYAQGRIDATDVEAALDEAPDLAIDQVLYEDERLTLRRKDLYRISLVYGIEALDPAELSWSIQECGALEGLQADVPPVARHRLLESIKRQQGLEALAGYREKTFVRQLWEGCLGKLGLTELRLHPEELVDLSRQQAESILAASIGPGDGREPLANRRILEDVRCQLDALLRQVGDEFSLRGLLLRLTGEDLLDRVRPALIRHCASYLDEGIAAWHAPNRTAGFYSAWRENVRFDFTPYLAEFHDCRPALATLPEDAADAVIAELQRLGLPEERWAGYLRRIALELPGWSGIMNWRWRHPEYPHNRQAPVRLMDYLAVRLSLDRLCIQQACRTTWGIGGSLPEIGRYFYRHPAEFVVRHALFREALPEYLAARCHRLLAHAPNERHEPKAWRTLADMIFTWRHSSVVERSNGHSICRSAWRMFRLAQHLGLTVEDLAALPLSAVENCLRALDEFTPNQRGYLWLMAYERHYREEIFSALAGNHGAGRWAVRELRPESQIVFCMDDREESIRRHLEEMNPKIETLGAAGFFGVALNWRGLDDTAATPLCPVVVTPAHEVRETPRKGGEQLLRRHERRKMLYDGLRRWFTQESRRNLLSGPALIGLLAPGVLLSLIGKVFFPERQARLVHAARAALVPEVPTGLVLTRGEDGALATPEHPQLGFTDAEQADRVAAFLHNIGLSSGFAPLVVLMGHGSISQNNPHLAAYDCGACSGRHGGPNARVFAAMANRPEVRTLLPHRGIQISEDTWFIGAEHNTCNEEIVWFDLADLPPIFRPAWNKLQGELDQACRWSAHERCRRFASAPRNPALGQALRHVVARSTDFSQARPELGHATNAAAFVGRRAMSQGVFFDRRVFLISYDPTRDPAGTVLEGILLAVGPVGAGISLEYYFSTVNNERLGCGTKVPHNVVGMFGVMEGSSSDLRTGLPRQMVEIHEAMRLLIVIEHRPEIVTAIYERQPPLRELIGHGWVQLAIKDPDDGGIQVFDPRHGFLPWSAPARDLPSCVRSADWYSGRSEPLPPALIRGDRPLQEVRPA